MTENTIETTFLPNYKEELIQLDIQFNKKVQALFDTIYNYFKDKNVPMLPPETSESKLFSNDQTSREKKLTLKNQPKTRALSFILYMNGTLAIRVYEIKEAKMPDESLQGDKLLNYFDDTNLSCIDTKKLDALLPSLAKFLST